MEDLKNEIVVYSGVCRCCLEEKKGNRFLGLWEKYLYNGNVEVYGEMITECFLMPWAQPDNPEADVELICGACVSRVRDAFNFKQQLLVVDEKLAEHFEQVIRTETVKEEETDDKSEITIEVQIDSNIRKSIVKSEFQEEVSEGCDISDKYESDNQDQPKLSEGSDTSTEYESGAPLTSTKKKLRTEIVNKKCVTTYLRQDFRPSETQSTDNVSLRDPPLEKIGDILIKHENNEIEVDNKNSNKDHVQKPRQISAVRLNKTPKTSAERAREFRARRALLKQQSKRQASNAIVESAASSEYKQAPGPFEIRTKEERAKSAEATQRWREKKKGVNESPKKQAKTAAERMREYRQRKKIAKQILLKQQSEQNLNQKAGPSTINSMFADLTRRGNSQSQ